MRNIIRIFKMSKKYWWFIFVAIGATIIQTGIQLYTPMILSSLTKLFETPTEQLASTAFNIAMRLLILYVIAAAMQFCRSYFSHLGAWNFVHDMRTKLYDHIQNLSLKFFTDKQTGQLMSRIFRDSEYIEVLIAHAIPDMLVNIMLLVGVCIIMFFINYKLALASVIIFPLIVLLVLYYVKKIRPIFKKSHQKAAELNATLQDNLSGIKEIQIFNQQESELCKVAEDSMQFTDLTISGLKKSAVFHPAVSLLSQVGTVIVIIVGGLIAYKGGVGTKEIVAFLLYLSMFYQPVLALGRLTEDLQNASTAVDRMMEIMDIESEVKEKENASVMKDVKGEIVFENVGFSYNEGTEVIKDFNLKIKSGQTVALVGPTGVGKTTLASLIGRYYDPTEGRILIDGIDIRDVTLKSLRDNLSFVLQDVFLFNGTVYENITYGNKNATYEEVVKAAKIANADEFIEKMEDKYDTIIGERGVRLSGGQKQRLSIARAVLRNAPILVLDEATAAVDNETEKLIHQAIDNIIKDRTTIIIAHRLSTVKNADIIVTLEEGKIAEIGNHEQLIRSNGLYSQLYNVNFNEMN